MTKINLTMQRKCVLDVVHRSPDHPTAADVMERLRADGHHFAYGTVYNSLNYLVEAGLIRELKLGEASSRYDGRTDDHHHIVCRVCGRVDEVHAALPSAWLQETARETGYRIDEAHVILEGVCAACRSNPSSPMPN